MPSLAAPYDALAMYYPRRDKKDPNVYKYVDQVMLQFPGGTPCCVQMSHALNLAGMVIPSASNRRTNAYITLDNGAGYYYFGAVDELIDFLTTKCAECFAGEVVNQDSSGNNRSYPEITNYLQGRQGILAFWDLQLGAHTELWDGQDILQKDMNRSWCFNQPQVMFWDAGPPQWLTDAVASDTTP